MSPSLSGSVSRRLTGQRDRRCGTERGVSPVRAIALIRWVVPAACGPDGRTQHVSVHAHAPLRAPGARSRSRVEGTSRLLRWSPAPCPRRPCTPARRHKQELSDRTQRTRLLRQFCDRVLAGDHLVGRGAKRSPRRHDRFRRDAVTRPGARSWLLLPQPSEALDTTRLLAQRADRRSASKHADYRSRARAGVDLEPGNAVEFEQFRPRSSQRRHCWSHEERAAGVSWIRANADRPFGRNSEAVRGPQLPNLCIRMPPATVA